jgi:hypothetical protein
MDNKLYLSLVLLGITFAFLLTTATTTVLAAYNTTDVDVNISSLSQITLIPNYLNWTNLGVGTMGGYKNITVKNIGSANVSLMYAWVDTIADETARPYGSSDASLYAAGGLLTMRNETDLKYYYLGRIEWNWTSDIPNHVWPVTSPISWGYFRNLTNDYVWVLGNGTSGRCNESNTQLYYETDADDGSTGTRTPDNAVTMATSSGDPSRWSVGSIVAGTLAGQCVAAYYDCSKIFLYNYDRRANFSDCGKYFNQGNMVPGSTVVLRVDAWVPRGLPTGNLTRATLTVEAS